MVYWLFFPMILAWSVRILVKLLGCEPIPWVLGSVCWPNGLRLRWKFTDCLCGFAEAITSPCPLSSSSSSSSGIACLVDAASLGIGSFWKFRDFGEGEKLGPCAQLPSSPIFQFFFSFSWCGFLCDVASDLIEIKWGGLLIRIKEWHGPLSQSCLTCVHIRLAVTCPNEPT